MSKQILIIAAFATTAVGCRTSDDGRSRDVPPSAKAVEAEPAATAADREPDVIFVPTPEPVIDRMLRMAEVGPEDVVYDLGCGDGRIVVAAARDFGARAVGVDIDPVRVAEARARVRAAGVEDLVEIRRGDLFETDVSPATVVTLYLLPELNVKLRPKLMRELRPGSKVVSQSFDMGDWQPEAEAEVGDTDVYLWTIPERGARR